MLQQWFANFTKSPKTSIGGLIAALIIALPQVGHLIGTPVPKMDENGKPLTDQNGDLVYEEPKPVDIQTLVLAGALIWIGGQARDGDRSSEQVKKPKGDSE